MQQPCCKYFACRPPPSLTLGLGSKGQSSTLSEHGHVAYQIKRNHECSNMVANILLADAPSPPPPPPPPPPHPKGQNSTISEYGHVAYQIKQKHECSSMVANILPADPPPPPPQTPDPGDGVNRSKVNFFRTWS